MSSDATILFNFYEECDVNQILPIESNVYILAISSLLTLNVLQESRKAPYLGPFYLYFVLMISFVL